MWDEVSASQPFPVMVPTEVETILLKLDSIPKLSAGQMKSSHELMGVTALQNV